jgi:YVTN family beta-propeller protein
MSAAQGYCALRRAWYESRTASGLAAARSAESGTDAITPDGTRAYVANFNNTVSVIDTSTNMVVATITIPVGSYPLGVAITADGTRAYVANSSGTVSVIATATNTVIATVQLSSFPPGPTGVAITPDGTRAYVTIYGRPDTLSSTVLVIDTATNTVVNSVGLNCLPLGCAPIAIAITPDGSHAYVTNSFSNVSNVSVIDTASNTQVAMLTVPGRVAITPDGKSAYVANGSNTVSVINTATNTVVTTVPVPVGASQVATFPPVPFSAFSAKLEIHNQNAFRLKSEFTLGSAGSGINPPAEAVTLIVGTFATTIPAGSFTGKGYGPFHFAGTINGVVLEVAVVPTGAKRRP